MSKVFEFAPLISKAGVAYAERPNENTADFDVVRNSNSTYFDSDGLLKTASANVPRYTFETGDSCPSLLTEPQTTNVLEYSEDFTNAIWEKSPTTSITPNFSLSPDGQFTADRYLGTTTSSLSQRMSMFSIGQVVTLSVYAKSNNIGLDNTFKFFADSSLSSLDLEATDKWQKFSFTITVVNGGLNRPYGVARDSFNNDIDISFWGFQLEELNYASSYIPNLAAGSTTRLKDEVLNAGYVALFNSLEGVLKVDLRSLSNDTEGNSISINDGTTDNTVLVGFSNGTDSVSVFVRIGGNPIFSFSQSVPDITLSNELVLKWASGDYGFKVNGIEVATAVSGTIFPANTLSRVDFHNGAGAEDMHALTKQITVYNSITDY